MCVCVSDIAWYNETVFMPTQRTLNRNFFRKWTPEMAYVLGFFAADGYMIKNGRGAHFVDFYNNDREIIEGIKEAIGSNHKITVRKRSGNQGTSYRLQIGSKLWFGDLTKLGFMQNKSLVLRWPKIPKAFLGHFVRGYFDGDGSVHLGKYWPKDRNSAKWEFTSRFTSGSKTFLEGLWQALRRHVTGGYLYKKKKNGKKGAGFELVFSRRDSLALFRFMYHNITSDHYLRRKYGIFQRAFKVLNLRA